MRKYWGVRTRDVGTKDRGLLMMIKGDAWLSPEWVLLVIIHPQQQVVLGIGLVHTITQESARYTQSHTLEPRKPWGPYCSDTNSCNSGGKPRGF